MKKWKGPQIPRSLLHSMYEVHTEGGGYDKEQGGQWKPGTTVETAFQGVVMPLNNEDLQYIDSGSYTLNAQKVYTNTFSVKLGDRTFAFSIRYNEVGGFFTVDLSIASTGEVLVYGDIVRYGRPLFNSVEDERFPVPVIMPLCLTGDDISEVTFENFGKEVRLYLWERNAA